MGCFFYLGHPPRMTLISPLIIRVYFFCNSHHTNCHSVFIDCFIVSAVFMMVLTVSGSNFILLHTVGHVCFSQFNKLPPSSFPTWQIHMIFSDFFTLTRLHCTSLPRLGSSYFSNLISFIPDWLRWGKGIVVMSEWLCSFFTQIWYL